jgi:SAM-dependent methyltransferase
VSGRDDLRIAAEFNRSARGNEAWERESALWLLERMCERIGRGDLGDTEVLDMGCGVKFTKALLNEGLPIKRYVGIDVYREMIEHLDGDVDDPRFEYFHVDVKNDLYNPSGEPLTEEFRLPLSDQRFDLICLFSVFTHLPPDDYRAMLKVLRRHVRPDGRLFFTLYVNERTAGGHGLVDGWTRKISGHDAEISAALEARREQGLPAVEPFVDLDPSRPLNWAVYSRDFAYELMEGTGWTPLELSDPDVFIQHHFLCAPA